MSTLLVVMGGLWLSGQAGVASLAPAGMLPMAEPQQAVLAPYEGPVYAIGDSVMLGAKTCLTPKGIRVNASESRQFYEGASIINARKAAGKLPDRVVVALGTNGAITKKQIVDVVKAVDGRQVYFVNIQLPPKQMYSYEPVTNSLFLKVAAEYPNAHVIDWNTKSASKAGILYSDGTHVTPSGCKVYGRMINGQVRQG